MGWPGRCHRNNMIMGRKVLTAIFWTVVFLTACSVKEDRDSCPCSLKLEFSCTDPDKIRYVDVAILSQSGYEWRDTVEYGRDDCIISVPRTDLNIMAWAGAEGFLDGETLTIPAGQDCPRVYMHDSEVRIEGETAQENVSLLKNHCVMTIMTKGDVDISSNLVIRGNVSGYDGHGVPLQGEFECTARNDVPDEGYVVVLPRQTDMSLILEIDDGSGNRKAFALGKYIVSSGYDWNAAELEDLTVTLDYALTEIRLMINGWDNVYEYDIEI